MTADRHTILSDVFLQARARRGAERTAYLDEVCAGDDELRSHVEEMLQQDEHASVLMGTEAMHQAVSGPVGSAARPENIGPYHILGVLGEGGMGVVYEAEQERPHRTVALKVVRPGWVSERALRRFEHEVEVLGHLQHPGIAQIFEAGTATTAVGEQPYFAMELVHGRPLVRHAVENKLSSRQRLRLFVQICEAVQYAHQKGVIHRDLKPANVLVDDTDQVKVLDFGIARSTDSDIQTMTRQSDVGELIGTLPYMSPEQATGDPRQLDTRSDVYSLGVVLYELLAETLPYDVHNKLPLEAARIIREEEPTPLSSINRSFRGDLHTIVGKALEKQVSRRYQTASELAADIQRFLRDEPILARPPTKTDQIRKFARRNKVLVCGVLAVFVSLLLGLVVSLRLYLREQDAVTLASSNLDRFHQMADVRRYEDLQRQACDELWPAFPDKATAMQDWLDRAHLLTRRVPLHQSALEELRRHIDSAAEVSSVTDEDRWRQDVLLDLLGRIGDLQRPDPWTPGTIAEMEVRLRWAGQVGQRSIGDHRDEWDEATDEIFLSEQYGELELEPQLGLVPLGPDRDSGLWEFWLVGTGQRPLRDASTEELVMTEESGAVLVLIPGDTFWMGAQNTDPEGPNYDLLAHERELPVHQVSLDPYFLSKYEMSQGQWLLMTGDNPSHDPPIRVFNGKQHTLLHPVEEVNWTRCVEVLRKYGLELPTEAQWEYAARAGTSTSWWTGADRDSLIGAANLADQSAARAGALWANTLEWPELDDGYASHAPVNHYRANPFGLYNVHGNVAEWCRDAVFGYEFGVAPGDGERLGDGPFNPVYRGGDHGSIVNVLRCAFRAFAKPSIQDGSIGLRPARRIAVDTDQ